MLDELNHPNLFLDITDSDIDETNEGNILLISDDDLELDIEN